MTNKSYTNPKLSLINVPVLNYLLRSQIFVNGDGQLCVVHLILDFKPISRSFLDVGNSIRADDYRLACIDVSRPGFLAPHDLPPVDHPIPQGIPLVAQPLQQVPLGQAIIEEGATSLLCNFKILASVRTVPKYSWTRTRSNPQGLE